MHTALAHKKPPDRVILGGDLYESYFIVKVRCQVWGIFKTSLIDSLVAGQLVPGLACNLTGPAAYT